MVLFRRKFGVQCGVFAALWFLLTWMREAAALRPLRNRNPSPSAPWTDERIFLRSGGNDPTLFSGWNITGTYRGTWSFRGESNRSSKFLNFGVSNGMSVFQLASIPTKINGVHYVQGAVFFHDGHENDVGIAQMQVEGVYIWPFKQLRLVVSRGSDRELLHAEHYMSNPYHLLEAFSSQVFQDSTWDQAQRKNSLTYDIEKQCNIEISAQISQVTSSQAGLSKLTMLLLISFAPLLLGFWLKST